MTQDARSRVEGLRNLRTAYDLVAAVGFWKELHGEDLIEEYARLVEGAEQALYFLKQAIDGLGWQPFKNDEEWQGFIDEYGNAAAYLMSAQSSLEVTGAVVA